MAKKDFAAGLYGHFGGAIATAPGISDQDHVPREAAHMIRETQVA